MGQRPKSLLPGLPLPERVVTAGPTSITLGSAPNGRQQMVLFERGHWCSACRRHLAMIAQDHAEFVSRAIDIVAVTHEPGTDISDRVYPFPVIPDPDLALARLYDLAGEDEYGKLTIRPSTIVVGPDGLIRFSYVGDDSRDRPTIPALLLALDAAPGLDVGVGIRVAEANHHAQHSHPDEE